MSADRCYVPLATDEATRLTRIALDIEEMNEAPMRPGWSRWDLKARHATCALEGTAYVVRLVRPAGTKRKVWFWGRAGKPGGRSEESLEAAQIAAEAAAAIDGTLRGM